MFPKISITESVNIGKSEYSMGRTKYTESTREHRFCLICPLSMMGVKKNQFRVFHFNLKFFKNIILFFEKE